MLKVTSTKFAAGFLALAVYGLLQGFYTHDPLAFNEMLYHLGLWDLLR